MDDRVPVPNPWRGVGKVVGERRTPKTYRDGGRFVNHHQVVIAVNDGHSFP